VKLSPTQLRVLRYASEGRLVQESDGRAFIVRGGRVRKATVARLEAAELVRWLRCIDSPESIGQVTPKGQALLDELNEKGAPCRTT